MFIIDSFRFGGGAAPLSIVADPGSYALTGSAATLKQARLIAAASGSYALTGSDAALRQSVYRIAADAGSYALTGTDASFLKTWKIAADAGSYALTGVAATLTNADPYFASVVLLSGFEGADASTTFDDESTPNHTLGRTGDAQIDTAQFKYGASSLLGDGTGDAVTSVDSADWQLSTGSATPYTIDMHYRPASTAADRVLLGQYTATGNQRAYYLFIAHSTTGAITWITFTSGTATPAASTVSSGLTWNVGQWYHVCIEQNASGLVRIYVDGVMVGSSTPADPAIFNSTASLYIGMRGTDAFGSLNGHMDEVRITKGVARYNNDSGFTPPTRAYPRI